MARLAATLDRLDPPAKDDDAVFIDYCSLPQVHNQDMPSVYFEHNALAPPQAPR